MVEQFEPSVKYKSPSIFAFGSGKGGVGKTVLAASLGLGLAQLNKRVVVVDGDLAGANLHAVMGITKPERTYYEFYNREFSSLDDIVVEHPYYKNLKIIVGAAGSFEIANPNFYQKMRFIRELAEIDADFVILDLGAGSNLNVVDFFLAADHGVVVVNPEPLSILESFNFMKQVLYRKLLRTFRVNQRVIDVIQQFANTPTNVKPLAIKDLIKEVGAIEKEYSRKIESLLSNYHPMLLINGLRSSKEELDCLAVAAAVKELLSIDMELMGRVHYDPNIKKSLAAQEPFLGHDSRSRASKDVVYIITNQILHNGELPPLHERKSLLDKLRTRKEQAQKHVICSVLCIYWEQCDFKNEGKPCELGCL
jgi:flagellar biosynthesis protein FlhG